MKNAKDNQFLSLMGKLFFLRYLLILLILGGCSGEKIIPANIPDTADPNVVLNRLRTDIDQERQAQVDVLSPYYFSKSEQGLKKAQEQISGDRPNEEVIQTLAEATGYLNHAKEIAAVARTPLQDVLSERALAIQDQAPQAFGQDFKKADQKLVRVGLGMEKGDHQISDSDRNDLVQTYSQLKTNAIRQKTMAESLKVIEQAKKEGAERWAPRTLAKTEQEVTQLQQLINNKPDETDSISQAANELRDHAEFLLKLNRQSKLIDTRDSEDVALKLDQQNYQLGQIQNEAQSAKENLNEQRKQTAALESDVEFNERFKTISSSFSPAEAEVLRTDHKILIRLKGLHFQVAGTAISPKDYALLNKVTVALKEFKDSPVVIEGHTDSLGSKKANLQLSKNRAQAVQSYLVANHAVDENRVKSEGKGFNAPIASNRTKAGRAENRRVDIIIETQA